MSTLNEVKEQMIVVKSVGDFTNALQQIATLHMMRLRTRVMQSRPFVEAANELLTELVSIRNGLDNETLMKMDKKAKADAATKAPVKERRAVVVITSNQGLSGQYNQEIYRKVEKVIVDEKNSDFFVIGKKGQEYYANARFKINAFPYEVKEEFTIHDLKRLITMFDYYNQVTLVYSRYINSATRDVVATSIVNPVPVDSAPDLQTQPGKYIFEPDLPVLIEGISKQLRGALFQQQILDSRLSQAAAQMLGMKTASDNANQMMGDLRLEYNKQRRKMIDKKISEVFAGSALWKSWSSLI